ncbi:putative nuclease HARBI1 [Hyla sarda]|uniref:putative nuclease HARBI1 n=1 Tax=Hyla sarda TaxID=327740 RepID=UPI0024C2E755|nr:putative nuclease HARBI1 [Hyla sarda]
MQRAREEDRSAGDNGYRLMPWLLNPYLHPPNQDQRRYNVAHRRTRSQIERVFGLLKSRFRCLDVTGWAMLYNPVLVCKIILACCVLHNIATANAIPVEIAEDLQEHINCPGEVGNESSQAGILRRNEIAKTFFHF